MRCTPGIFATRETQARKFCRSTASRRGVMVPGELNIDAERSVGVSVLVRAASPLSVLNQQPRGRAPFLERRCHKQEIHSRDTRRKRNAAVPVRGCDRSVLSENSGINPARSKITLSLTNPLLT